MFVCLRKSARMCDITYVGKHGLDHSEADDQLVGQAEEGVPMQLG